MVTLSGQAVVEMGRVVKPGLTVKKDADGKRVIDVSLAIPANSWADVEEAKNFLDPNRPRRRKRGGGESELESLNKPSASWLARPSHLKLNSYGLLGIEERPEKLPLLIFRLVEEYPYQEDGEEKRFRWILPPLYLQGMIMRWVPSAQRALLPRSMQQGACQEVAQQIISHWSLQEDPSQPSTSFPSFTEREPEERRRQWREALLRLSRRTEPFPRRKHRGEMVIDDPDVKLFRDGPYPKRMTARFIGSDDALVWQRRQSKQLYVSLPVWKGVGDGSNLLRFLEQEQRPGKVNFFWWRDCLEEFAPLSAWPTATLRARDDLLMVAVSDEKGRLQDWLSESDRRVCWSVITERQVQGQPEFYLQITTQVKVKPRLRPNLLTVLPTLEDGGGGPEAGFRYALTQEGRICSLGREVVDPIPTGPIKHGRSWRKSRQQRAIRAGRKIADLANKFDANLAIGEPAWPDKRSGDTDTNTINSRWNYSALIWAIVNKAADHRDPVAIVARVSPFERRKVCQDAEPLDKQIVAVAQIAWANWKNKGKPRLVCSSVNK
ncbi:hypothetical protein IT398_02470 [Candidatus Nomurabacteria bacterium]|nr:hypothetical protein [Candidatus Nomurabacteria bacterium]